MGTSRRSKIVRFLIATVVAMACIRYIATRFQWMEIGQILRRVDLFWLVVGGGASIVSFWLVRALRWFMVLKNVNVRIRFYDLYMCSSVSLALSIVTPLQVGEMAKVELLGKVGGLERLPGYTTFVVERLLDLCVVGVVAAVSLAVEADLLSGSWHLPIVIGAAVVLLTGGLLALRRVKIGGRAGEVIGCLRTCVRDVKGLVVIVSLTAMAWLTVALGWQACLRSVSVAITYPRCLALMSVMTLVNVLSCIPGAVGISEAGIAEVLLRFGHDAAHAQAGALILRVYGIMAIVSGLVHLLIWRRRALR